MSAKYGDLVNLYNQLDALGSHEDFMIQTLKELAARILRATKKATPKKTGNLKREWKVGEVKKVGNSYQIEIYNNVEYAPYVEYGHRTRDHTGWINGYFMLTLSENMVARNAEGIIQRKLEQYIKERLND